MPIDRFFSPLRAAILAVSAKCGAGASSTGGMHIKSGNRQTILFAATGDESRLRPRPHARLLRFIASIDLRRTIAGCRFCEAISFAKRFAQARTIDRMNGVEQRHGLLGLVGLQRPDEMQRDTGIGRHQAAATLPWPPERDFHRTHAGRRLITGTMASASNVFDTAISVTDARSRRASLQAREDVVLHRKQARLAKAELSARDFRAPSHLVDHKLTR